MPPRRQLPWARKGAASTPSNKRTTVKRTVPSDVDDDDFFKNTMLESPRRSKRAAVSDDEFPGFTPRRRSKESSVGDRMPSSSPPPITADLPPPTTEYMLTGIDKFDLRDDEWMMVEDELLQTAKLFTQHLHLAEYETLKAKMEEQRKVATPRPVVANAKPSSEGHFKAKGQEQAKKQKSAMKKMIVSHGESSEEDAPPLSSPLAPPRTDLLRKNPASTILKSVRPAKPLRESSSIPAHNKSASDSDDLDTAPKAIKTETNLTTKPPTSPALSVIGNRHRDFKKPAIPASARKIVRSQRRNLWDEWDAVDLKSTSTTSKPSNTNNMQSNTSPIKVRRATVTYGPSSPTKSTPKRTARGSPTSTSHFRTSTLDNGDVKTSTHEQLTSGTSDRSTERKTNEQQHNKKPKYDDIPTFLF